MMTIYLPSIYSLHPGINPLSAYLNHQYSLPHIRLVYTIYIDLYLYSLTSLSFTHSYYHPSLVVPVDAEVAAPAEDNFDYSSLLKEMGVSEDFKFE